MPVTFTMLPKLQLGRLIAAKSPVVGGDFVNGGSALELLVIT